MNIVNTLMMLLFLAPTLILFPLCAALQKWLCAKEVKWYGFVLPTIHCLSFIPVLLVLMGSLVFGGFGGVSTTTSGSIESYNEVTGEWVVVEDSFQEKQVVEPTNWGMIGYSILAMIVYHIPTVTYIYIYKKSQKEKENDLFSVNVEKMSLQDLE